MVWGWDLSPESAQLHQWNVVHRLGNIYQLNIEKKNLIALLYTSTYTYLWLSQTGRWTNGQMLMEINNNETMIMPNKEDVTTFIIFIMMYRINKLFEARFYYLNTNYRNKYLHIHKWIHHRAQNYILLTFLLGEVRFKTCSYTQT